MKKEDLKLHICRLEDLAKEAKVSTATISRFWKLAGFKNFKEFKDHVKHRIETTPENKLKNFILDIGSDDLFDRVIDQNYEYLFQTHMHLNREDLNDAVKAIINAKGYFSCSLLFRRAW